MAYNFKSVYEDIIHMKPIVTFKMGATKEYSICI